MNAHRPKRRPTNVTIDAALAAEAKRLGFNLSKLLEATLRDAVGTERRRRWLEENQKGFQAYGRFVERHGIFNETDRDW